MTITAARLCTDATGDTTLDGSWLLDTIPTLGKLWTLVELSGDAGERYTLVYAVNGVAGNPLWSGGPLSGYLTRDGTAVVVRPLQVRVQRAEAIAFSFWPLGQSPRTVLSVVAIARER